LLYILLQIYVCFCYGRYSFSVLSQASGWDKTSPKCVEQPKGLNGLKSRAKDKGKGKGKGTYNLNLTNQATLKPTTSAMHF